MCLLTFFKHLTSHTEMEIVCFNLSYKTCTKNILELGDSEQCR